MPDEPEVPESPVSEPEERPTFFVPEANVDLSDDGLRIVLDEEQLEDLSQLLDQNSGGSPGCISMPGGPRC
jgi:hypothetical protein